MKKIKNLPYIALALLVHSDLMAQAKKTCDSSDQACLTAPEGLLTGNAKATSAIQFFNWILFSVSMVGAITFGIKAAKKMSDEQWFGALGPGLASVVCGLATYIAFSVTS